MRYQDVATSTRETQESLLANRQGSLPELPSRDHRPDAFLAATGGRSAAACARLLDFPEVRISTGRLDIREFGPADAGLVSEVAQGGEWLPLSTGGWLTLCTSLAATEPG